MEKIVGWSLYMTAVEEPTSDGTLASKMSVLPVAVNLPKGDGASARTRQKASLVRNHKQEARSDTRLDQVEEMSWGQAQRSPRRPRGAFRQELRPS